MPDGKSGDQGRQGRDEPNAGTPRKYQPDDLGRAKVGDGGNNSTTEVGGHIPASALRHLNVDPGDEIVFKEDGGQVVMEVESNA